MDPRWRHSTRPSAPVRAAAQMALCLALSPAATAAESAAPITSVAGSAAGANRPLAVAALSFADFYRSPIGPRGLEPGPRLLALAGSRIQLDGFIAHGAEPLSGFAIIAALPVTLSDEDESLADDLPAAVAYLRWSDARVAKAIAGCRHAVRVTGRLELGAIAEPDGRVSFVRVRADGADCAR